MISLAIGFDQREAISYHVFCQSILEKSSQPVAFTPLVLTGLASLYKETHKDASNSFIYSRFLTPLIFGYSGWAIYADSDMVCQRDISELWSLRNDRYAVMVVPHDYKTKHRRKYLGNVNQDYPRKNWSSLILWNNLLQVLSPTIPELSFIDLIGLRTKTLGGFHSSGTG
jgi:lipopolysaccharide biosynthesis glycosyltransferase